MGCPVRMSGEIRDWLHELRDRDPREARVVCEALAALAAEGTGLGPPLVVTPQPPGLPPGLDEAYQEMLERMAAARRRVADAATQAKRIELRIAALEEQRERFDGQRREAGGAGDDERAQEWADRLAAADDELTGLRRQLSEAGAAQKTLAERSRRLQARVEAFRVRKEVLKARRTAALAEQQTVTAMAAFEPDGEGAADAAARADAAEEKVRQTQEEILAALADIYPAVPEPGLLEVRTGAPGPSPVRILFAMEPPGEVLLLAVLDGSEAARERHGEAVAAASDLLRLARAGHAPEACEHACDGAGPLLEEFLPGQAAEAAAGAAALAARLRGRTLAQRRVRLGLTVGQVAGRMGVTQDQVAAIERGGPGEAAIGVLAGYVEALGGELEVVAQIAGERVRLR